MMDRVLRMRCRQKSRKLRSTISAFRDSASSDQAPDTSTEQVDVWGGRIRYRFPELRCNPECANPIDS
jgi:hypothetical protein